jgi:hypothetical protein
MADINQRQGDFVSVPREVYQFFRQFPGGTGVVENLLEALAWKAQRAAEGDQDLYTYSDVIFNSVLAGYYDFDLSPTSTIQEGRAQWNPADGTLDVGLPGSVVGQMFQETFFDGKNRSGADIADGKPVMFAAPVGASGKVEFQLAIADGSIPSEYIMGITTEPIANGEFGKITWFGKVRGIDTTGTPYGEVWADGDLIYVGTTAGSLTNVEPNVPAQRILLASVIVSHQNGTLLVRPTWVPKLTELDDVNGTPLTTTGQLLVWDNVNKYFDFSHNIDDYQLKPTIVSAPVSLETYDPSPARGGESDLHGGLQILASAQPLDTVPTNIVVTKGTGKVVVSVNAGSDIVGDITVTGTTVDRNTGTTTPADTDTISVDALTVNTSTTDSNGNTKYSGTNIYITSKWFTGSVTLSTANLTLTDVDVYHLSFEQFNDSPNITVETFDQSLYTTNVAAEFDSYLQSIEVTGDKATVELLAELHIGADGETAIANKYWRLRRGNINKSLDGTTDGVWVVTHYSNSPAYVEDVNTKVWASKQLTAA